MAEKIVGFVQFYGLTPCINFLQDSKEEIEKDERDMNYLLSETGDLRHVLKSVSDILPLKNGQRKHKLNIYLHEKEYGCLARDLIFLTILCETALSKRERMELFVDLYANCLIRDKTDLYLQGILNELLKLVTEDTGCSSVLRQNVHMDCLKFRERDNLEDTLSSYYSNHHFDIEKQLEQRQRAHLKERYDHRANMYDWDYNMHIKELAPYIHPKEYKTWRKCGLAFEWRLTENKIPNRTFSSYIPGYNKKVKQNVLVRGYWGDILQSPYIPFGLEIWKEYEAKEFFQKINYQLVYSCLDVTMYNIQYYIQKLEDMTEYNFPFERVKNIKEQLTGLNEGGPNPDEEPKVQEVTDEESKEETPKTAADAALDHLTKGGKTLDLSNVKEGDEGTSIYEDGDRQYLKGLQQANVHFHLMADSDIKQLKTKKKFRNLFDGGVLSMQSCAHISDEMTQLFKDKSRVYVETGDFLIALNKEQRIGFRKLVLAKTVEQKWENIAPSPYKHHFLFEVKNPNSGSQLEDQAAKDEEEEDLMDLSGL